MIWKFITTDNGMVFYDIDKSPSKALAVSLYFKKLETIGKISLTLIGALWAFLVYTENRVDIKRWDQILLFVTSNLFLLCSFATYYIGFDFVMGRIFYHATIDFQAPIISFWDMAQTINFLGGISCSTLTVLVCLKR